MSEDTIQKWMRAAEESQRQLARAKELLRGFVAGMDAIRFDLGDRYPLLSEQTTRANAFLAEHAPKEEG